MRSRSVISRQCDKVKNSGALKLIIAVFVVLYIYLSVKIVGSFSQFIYDNIMYWFIQKLTKRSFIQEHTDEIKDAYSK